jgi:MacB-like periplasmic core domain
VDRIVLGRTPTGPLLWFAGHEDKQAFHRPGNRIPGARDRGEHGNLQFHGRDYDSRITGETARATRTFELASTRARSGVVNTHTGSSYREAGSSVSPNYPYHAYELLRDHNHVFSSLFAFAQAGRLNAVVHGQALLEIGEYVSSGYFAGLGVKPAIGRLVSQADDQPGAAAVVVISYAFWQGQFGGSPHAVGTSILINGKSSVVVGATPE